MIIYILVSIIVAQNPHGDKSVYVDTMALKTEALCLAEKKELDKRTKSFSYNAVYCEKQTVEDKL